jgi:glycosyltransferase involved in cell wall biosynthesis
LYKLVHSERISIIETFTHHANLLGLPVAWAARVPFRIASHHGRIEKLGRILERIHTWMINQDMATVMVAVSEQVRRQAVHQEGIRPDKVCVIANGIDFPLAASLNPEARASLARSLGLKPGGCLVLSVGRLRVQKGHTYLLEAIPEVLDQFPDTIFAVAGEGELRADLEAKAQELGIAGAVRFLGNVANMAELLNIADLFVLPSLWEGLPLALLEAMMAGLPVVATQVEGVEEVIQSYQNGLLVPPADPEALRKAIIQLLEDDRQRAQLGQAAQATIINKFTVDRMCKAYEALFLSLPGMTQ